MSDYRFVKSRLDEEILRMVARYYFIQKTIKLRQILY